MEKEELLLPSQVRQEASKIVIGYGMCKTPKGRDYFRSKLQRVAEAAKMVDPEFYAELIEKGYVKDSSLESGMQPVARSITLDFTDACNNADVDTLERLREQEPELYEQELKRLLEVVAARINQLRIEGGGIGAEMIMRKELRGQIGWLPGLELGPARTQAEVEEERTQLSDSLDIQKSLSIQVEKENDKELGLGELTPENIADLSPRDLQRYMKEIFDGGGFIPGNLNKPFNSGIFTEVDIKQAKDFLSGFVQRMKAGKQPTGFTIVR